jgi:RimK family alpha-L-glutamate ligase
MKVGILHHDLERQEEVLRDELVDRGFEVGLYDVRTVSISDLAENDVVLNRVFASVANRNYRDNLLALDVLEELEDRGVHCINSHLTTKCDYSKYFSALKMKEAGVMTPETFFIGDLSELGNAVDFARKVGFDFGSPVVLKRDIGGRGKDVHLVKTEEHLVESLNTIFGKVGEDDYEGGWVVQEFVKSVLDYDYRVSMINGKIVYSMTRSFVKDEESGETWIASMTLGSKETYIELSEKIRNISLLATESIRGFFNDVDIMVGEKGPYVIENNPTPNFAKREEGSESDKMNVVISELVKEITAIRDRSNIVLDLVVEIEEDSLPAVEKDILPTLIEQSRETIEQESDSSKLADVVA